MKKKIFTFALLLLAVSSVNALSLSFQILQSGEKNSDVNESSYLVEDGLFDYFFGRGIIASNSPAAVFESKEKLESFYRKSLGESRAGGSDYFVMIEIFYDSKSVSNPQNKLSSSIEKISFEITECNSDKIIAQNEFNFSKNSLCDEKSIYSVSQKIAGEILNELLK